MEIDYEIVIRFLLSALWGGIVGLEREYRNKSAGFRTMILISVGACFFTMMSVVIGEPGNPDRIASNIVTGIGFLGAGVIFRGDNRVNGITTAATIWAVAAVGMGIGTGYYFASAVASLLIIFVLAILPYVEKMVDKMNQTKTYKISYHPETKPAETFEKMFDQYHLNFKKTEMTKQDNICTVVYAVQGRASRHEQLIREMMGDETIIGFSC